MMIESVKFNTKEKAKKCYDTLGKRAIDIFIIKYKGRILGYLVNYFTKN